MLLAATASTCSVPTEEDAAQRSLAYVAFDSRSGPYGWRILSAAGCTDSAVSLLAYSDANAKRLSGEQNRELWFHVGQSLALAGREVDAVPYFERAQSISASLDYVQATLAFPHRDLGKPMRKPRGQRASSQSTLTETRSMSISTSERGDTVNMPLPTTPLTPNLSLKRTLRVRGFAAGPGSR